MRYLVLICVVASAMLAQDFKLPPPFATPSARNQSHLIERLAGAELKVPAGFVVEEYMSADRDSFLANQFLAQMCVVEPRILAAR